MSGFEKIVSEISDHKIDVPGEFTPIRSENSLSKSDLTALIREEFEKARLEDRPISRGEIYGISEDNIDIDLTMSERMLELLDRFEPQNWEQLTDSERLDAVETLVKEIGSELGLREIPAVYLVDREDSYCGSYAYGVNSMVLNKNGFDDPKELVDTIAHELRHAYQYIRAEEPETYVDHLYRANCDNYISPEYNRKGECVNFNEYYNQYIEADARAYAKAYTNAME